MFTKHKLAVTCFVKMINDLNLGSQPFVQWKCLMHLHTKDVS